ncbi:MAG: hypothetical protein AAB341_02755 [Planctomycetota bacterium]
MTISSEKRTPLWPGVAAAAWCGLVYFAFGSDWTFRPRPSLYVHHTLAAQAWLQGRLHVTAAEIERQFMRNTLRRDGRSFDPVRTDAELHAAYDDSKAEYFRSLGVPERDIETEVAGSIRRAYLDWIHIDDRYYAYWPPVPALMIVPLVALFGPGVSDVVVANFLGAVSVFWVYVMLAALRRHWPAFTRRACLGLTLFYGLGTCHMYQACAGQVWLITQLSATFFLIIAIALGFRSFGVRTGDDGKPEVFRPGSFVAAAVALALGFLSRNTIILAAPFFAVLLWVAVRNSSRRFARFMTLGCMFSGVLLCAVAVQLAFNDARFDRPLDFGQEHLADEGGNALFSEEFKTFGRFSIHFIPRNLWYYFVNPGIREYPAIESAQVGWTFDPMGNSLFLVSPPMVYLFLCGRQRRRWLPGAVLAGAMPGTAALMLFHGTGWYQFGQRYLLDVMAFLLLLVAFGMRGRLSRVSIALVLLSLATNAWGTYRFIVEQG